MYIKIEEQWNRDTQILKVGLESAKNTMNEISNFILPLFQEILCGTFWLFLKLGPQFVAKGKFINL